MAQASPFTTPQTHPKKRSGRNREKWIAFLFLLPSILAIAIFVYGFIGWTGYISLSKWNTFVQDLTFSGLGNYRFLFNDFRFQSDLRNTIIFTVLFTLLCIGLGLFLAVLLDQKIKWEGLFRNIFIFPMALSFIVTGVVWQWIFNPSTGINLILKKIGITDPPLWYVQTRVVLPLHIGQIQFGVPMALIAVVIAAVWQLSGFTMAMYLSGLRSIPDELKEAARVDGATEWQTFRYILLPQLKPITFSAVVILGHISLKIFDLIYAMTGPGAAFVTDMPGLYMVETTFKGSHYAQGASIAIIMLLLVSLLIVPYLIFTFRKEETA
ncbi:sugar ABC transporter permease [Polycladomyces abyssicola]|uniref:Sugar ABC transporter permease n=1 Tax=Polycladomyces abyssicola TaxID=1125966 RepID=A0A8D5UGD0_9BACL|nr:sugar ABC transporter permease [Polycladomyces abyssicola]BCU81966.1 sugar ABC transporter permease [Polycladomyces abyssicola]